MLTQIRGKDAILSFQILNGKLLAVIHDENRNGELDTYFGIPKEGFSSGAKVTMSALRFLMLYFYMMEDICKCLYLFTIKF
jgi:uncharacterized protein (DUF2141 family)